MNTNKRRLAIVGTGHRGAGTWGRDVPATCAEEVQLVGLSDLNPARLAVVADQLGAENAVVSTDLDAMLAAARPHTLVVCTRDDTHADIIVKALEAGIDVVTEKPMATTAADCRRILDAEARTGRRVDVAFNYRFAPTSRKIRELLASGAHRRGHLRATSTGTSIPSTAPTTSAAGTPTAASPAASGCTRRRTTSTS